MTANVSGYTLVLNVEGSKRSIISAVQVVGSLFSNDAFPYVLGPPVQHVCGQTSSKTGQGKKNKKTSVTACLTLQIATEMVN